MAGRSSGTGKNGEGRPAAAACLSTPRALSDLLPGKKQLAGATDDDSEEVEIAGMQLREHRRGAVGLADLLLYDALVDDGVLLLQDGALLAGWTFRGPDMASATHAEMAALSIRLNNIIRLGSGWMIHCDAIRTKAPEYPSAGAFPDAVTRIIDDERRAQFMAKGAHFESEYFLTITYLPPLQAEEKVAGWMYEGRKQKPGAAASALSRFRAKTASFEDIFKSLFVVERLRRVGLRDDCGFRSQCQLLRYVRRCVV